MQRIYLDSLLKNEETLEISNRDFLNQMIKVLRSRVGDKIAFFNGVDLLDFVFEIKEVNTKKISFKKIEEIKSNNEINFSLNLYQSYPNKIEKIEYLLQKGTEIGISNFYFFASERSQKLPITENKKTRFEKIIIEAVEQSGRNIVPKIEYIDKMDYDFSEEDYNIFFDIAPEKSFLLKDLKIEDKKKVNIFVGPEGGWTVNEIEKYMNNKFIKCYLGERVLRTETVGTTVGFYIIQNKL